MLYNGKLTRDLGFILERYWPAVFRSDCVLGGFTACVFVRNETYTNEPYRSFKGMPFVRPRFQVKMVMSEHDERRN